MTDASDPPAGGPPEAPAPSRRANDNPHPAGPPLAVSELAMPDFAPGTVWLAGAGPGDPSLLTLQAAHALAEADIVFYDALVNGDVLRLARPDAERVFVGKRAGIASPRQGEITRRLIEAARAGLRVLRLKGGDPFVFARGAEEALAIARAGVPFRVVPGITSGIGGLAYAGLPLTHRDYNQAVTFVTAHDAGGRLAQGLDWPALSRASPVLVVYMGFRLLAEIRDALLAAGRPAAQPVAVVSRATTSAQRTLVTTLAQAPEAVAEAGLTPPAVIVIGEIVALRAALEGGGMPLPGEAACTA